MNYLFKSVALLSSVGLFSFWRARFIPAYSFGMFMFKRPLLRKGSSALPL